MAVTKVGRQRAAPQMGAAVRCTFARSERRRRVRVAPEEVAQQLGGREGDRTSPLPALRHLSGGRLLIHNLTGGHHRGVGAIRDRQAPSPAHPTHACAPRSRMGDPQPSAERCMCGSEGGEDSRRQGGSADENTHAFRSPPFAHDVCAPSRPDSYPIRRPCATLPTRLPLDAAVRRGPIALVSQTRQRGRLAGKRTSPLSGGSPRPP